MVGYMQYGLHDEFVVLRFYLYLRWLQLFQCSSFKHLLKVFVSQGFMLTKAPVLLEYK